MAYIITAISERLAKGTQMNPNGNTLAALKRGQRGVISAVDAACPHVQRLMTLGLVEGAEIELMGAAIGGDPLEFRLFGRGISLRAEQARHFSVQPSGMQSSGNGG